METFFWEFALVLFAMWSGSMLRDWRLDKFWDEWRGTEDRVPVMLIRRLVFIPIWRRAGKTLSIVIDLHKFVGPDAPDCFHTHPAYAIRVIGPGGYVEELFPPTAEGFRQYAVWRPFMIGLVRPPLAHRVARVFNGRWSYSVWIRGPIIADVALVGPGWKRARVAPERN